MSEYQEWLDDIERDKGRDPYEEDWGEMDFPEFCFAREVLPEKEDNESTRIQVSKL